MSGKSPPTRKLDSRAQSGRSTFYAHYRAKDDLFLSDVEDFLELMSDQLLRQREASNRIVPVRELLMHFADLRPLLSAL